MAEDFENTDRSNDVANSAAEDPFANVSRDCCFPPPAELKPGTGTSSPLNESTTSNNSVSKPDKENIGLPRSLAPKADIEQTSSENTAPKANSLNSSLSSP